MTMPKIVCFSALSLILLVSGLDATAGPWPQKKRAGFYKLGFGFVRANSYYEPNGRRIDIPTLSDYTVSLYGEYGLTDRLTAIAYLPVMQRLTLNRQIGRETGVVFFEGDENTSVADADVGFRFGLLQMGNTVVSAALNFGLPIGDHTQQSGLWTGDGEFNQRVSIGAGHSFYPMPAYMAIQAGINNRTQGFSDEFLYDLEAGYTFDGRVSLIGKLRGLEPLRNGSEAIRGGTGGLYANNQRYLVYMLEVAYNVNSSLGFSISVEGATRGQNILSAPAYRTGVFLVL